MQWLESGLGKGVPEPAPNLSNSAVEGDWPASNMLKVGAQSIVQPGKSANRWGSIQSSNAMKLGTSSSFSRASIHSMKASSHI